MACFVIHLADPDAGVREDDRQQDGVDAVGYEPWSDVSEHSPYGV